MFKFVAALLGPQKEDFSKYNDEDLIIIFEQQEEEVENAKFDFYNIARENVKPEYYAAMEITMEEAIATLEDIKREMENR